MRTALLTAATALALAAAASAGPPKQPAPPPADEGATDSYVVVYADTVDVDAKTGKLEAKGVKTKDRYYDALKGFAGDLTEEEVEELRSDGDVLLVAEDTPVSADGMVALRAGETVPTGVARIGAATAIQAHPTSSAAVAVLDTGLYRHSQLTTAAGKNCIDPRVSPLVDDNGHGTHVAGIIGAKNDGKGIVGVAPGTKLYALKVLNAYGNGSLSTIICGLDWVTANAAKAKIRVANLSLGGPGWNDGNCGYTNGDPLHMAICRTVAKGVTVVAAAGNSGADLAGSIPAAYPEVLAVTAVADSDGRPGGVGPAPACVGGQSDDVAASFSNYAADVDALHTIAAPGVCIYSTWPGGGYATLSGTSMAAPHAAGSVALCIATSVAGPCAGLPPAQVIQKVRADAQQFTSANPGFGFKGDPFNPFPGKYFHFLGWDGAY